MKTSISLALLFLLVALNGCALSPQTVAMKPLVDARSEPVGRGRALRLDVIDQRPQESFGSRGGVYSTAAITPRTDVAQTVHQALAERLNASDFKVVPADAGATSGLSLTVSIQAIDYVVTPGVLYNEIRLQSVINAVARNGQQVLKGRYQAENVRRQIGYPNEVDNELLINEVVGESLRQLLHDPKLLAFLRL